MNGKGEDRLANREAQVTFKANTSQFNSGIKQTDAVLKQLRSELKLNATQLKGNSTDVDLLRQRQAALKTELAASREKVVLVNAKLDEAKKIFGENSTEAKNLTVALNNAKNAEQGIANELDRTNGAIEQQEQAMIANERANSAYARSMDEAAQSVEQADKKIDNLDKELELNATKLEGAKNKTDLLKERQKLLGEQYTTSSTKVKTLEQALETCGQEVGKNSTEYTQLSKKLTEAKTEEEALKNKIQTTTTELRNQKNSLELAGTSLTTFGNKAEAAGRNVAVVSAAAVAVGIGTAKAAVDFESAFAGVTKTVDEVYDANGKCTYSYQQLEDGIRNMALKIPSTTTEIAGVAEAAGQLGIKSEDILAFTRVMIDMGNSTNLSSDVAATSLARFANITGLAADTSMTAKEKYGRLGSTIVELGNNYATTEAEITDMAMNLASAGTQVGMSQSDILALATALSSVGLESQAGGTAFSKALIDMQLAVETNSASLIDWASVAGMSTDEFATAFKTDATGALEAFIKGLSTCDERGVSAIATLDNMGITETRMRDALLRSANASDIFTSAIDVGSDAWESNTALTEEANKRYETTASNLKMLKNDITDVGITFGGIMLPYLQAGIAKLKEVCDWLNGLSDSSKRVVIGIGVFVALLAPALIIIGKVSSGIGAIATGLGGITKLFAGAGIATEGAGVAMGGAMAIPLLPIIGIVAGITATIAVFVLLWKKSEEFRDFYIGMWEGLKTTIQGFLDKINFGNKLDEIKEKFSGLGEKLSGLGDLFKVLGVIATAMIVPVLGVLAGLFESLLNAISPIIDIIGGAIDVLAGFGQMIVGVFTGDFEKAKEGANTFKDGVEEIFKGLNDLVIGILVGFGEGIKGFFTSLADTCGVTEFMTGVTEKIKSVWDEVVNKVAETFELIGNIISVGVQTIGLILSIAWELITLPFQLIWENCKQYVFDAWNSISTTVSEKLTGISNTINEITNAIFTTVFNIWSTITTGITDKWTEISTAATSKWNEIMNTIASIAESIKTKVLEKFEGVKSSVTTPLEGARTTVSSIMENIKTAISDKINSAKDAVKTAIDAIKGFFNFNWSLPKLKMPHVLITGGFSLNPPSAPKFDIQWNALGKIFTKPTILNTNAGLQGVGEAGAEAILPISVLGGFIQSSMNNVVDRMQRQEFDYERLIEGIGKKIAEQKSVVRIGNKDFERIVREAL